jgi:hypothetical protein
MREEIADDVGDLSGCLRGGLSMKRNILSAPMYAAMVLSLLAFPQQAYAYLDPGTGSYILQLTLAALFGAIYAVKLYWRRISKLVRKHLKRGDMETRD